MEEKAIKEAIVAKLLRYRDERARPPGRAGNQEN